jgi:hypothetical protein
VHSQRDGESALSWTFCKKDTLFLKKGRTVGVSQKNM